MNNNEKRREYRKNLKETNPEAYKIYVEYNKKWNKENREKRRKIKHNSYIKHKKEIFLKEKIRKKEDVLYKLKCLLRSRLYKALRNNQKFGSAVKDLGCSINEFKKYLEAKFTDEMSWDLLFQGKIHIDHIKPLSKFDLTDKQELLEACHYTNLQPLWAKDNLMKSDKYD